MGQFSNAKYFLAMAGIPHASVPGGPSMANSGLAPAVSLNPLTFSHGPTVADLQITGACDWYKIQRLVEAESKLIHLLKKDGLFEHAMKLEQMRDDVLAHRMANSPFESAKVFLRNNCANDAYIGKWRNDIDSFARDLAKTIEKEHVIPRDAISLRYHSQLLRQQSRASLPFTGYYSATPVSPSVKPGVVKDLPYISRFSLPPLPESSTPSLASFL